jgi:hypothetical protein
MHHLHDVYDGSGVDSFYRSSGDDAARRMSRTHVPDSHDIDVVHVCANAAVPSRVPQYLLLPAGRFCGDIHAQMPHCLIPTTLAALRKLFIE